MKQIEIISVEEEKKFLSSYFESYYRKSGNDDPFRGDDVRIISMSIYSDYPLDGDRLTLFLDARIDKGKVSYRYSCTHYPRESGVACFRDRDFSFFPFHRFPPEGMRKCTLGYPGSNEIDELIFLTESGNRIVLSPPDFDVSEDMLPIIMSNTTRFLISKKGLFEYRGQFDFYFPLPYQVVRFIVNKGNLPDAEIAELYDAIIRVEEEYKIKQDKYEKKKKKEKQEKERKEAAISGLKKHEDRVRELNLCVFETLKKILSSPMTIAEIAELEKYCSTHQLESSLLDKIKEIPHKYDIKKIREKVEECEEKSRLNLQVAKRAKYTLIGCFICTIYSIFFESGSILICVAFVVLSFFIMRKNKKPVQFDEYTSDFIDNVFK